MQSLFSNNMASLLVIIVLACLVWTAQYARRDLWEPDEARYTYVAQEMDQAGSWFMPMRNGEPYAHKPPLMFWLIKVGTLFTAGEYNGVSGRLPSLLGAILALWAFLKLGTSWFDRQTAWWGLLVLVTSYLFWSKGGMGQIDMLLLGLEMSALYLLFSNDLSPGRWRHIAAFSLMGLAILAKGPVGLIVPVGIYVTARLASGNGRKLLGWYWGWGILLALLFPACWLLLAKLTGAPDSYLNELLFMQNTGRFAGKFGGHVRPFYYYGQYLLIDFLPWTFLVPGSLYLLFKREEKNVKVKALLGWIIFVVLFFSLSSSKRNLYILSVYPAASLLVAAALPELKNLSRTWQRSSVFPLVGVLGLLGAAIPVVPWFVDLPISPLVYFPLALLLLGGACLLYWQFREHGLSLRWVGFAIGLFLLVEWYAGSIVLPAFNPMKTPVPLAEAVMEVLPENQPLLLYRMNGEIFALYSHRRGRKVESLEALIDEMNSTGRGVVVLTRNDWERNRDRLSGTGTINFFDMGKKHLCWLEYDVLAERQPSLQEQNAT